jgi:uncharacterized membrane protein YhfC
MIGLPIALGFFLTRKFGLGWGLVGVGALTFVASQVVHIPLLFGINFVVHQFLPGIPKDWALPFNAVVLGLMAGLCEEVARYVVYRRFIRTARTWQHALVFGMGHGGIEAIIFGGLAALTVAQMVILHNTDPNAWGVPAEQLALAQQQVADFWALPWYLVLLGAVERVFAICFHLSASVLVLQAFTRKNNLWLVAAIVWHSVLDGVAVLAVGTVGPYWTEAIVGIMAVISLAIIFALRDSGLGSGSVVGAAPTGVAGSVK